MRNSARVALKTASDLGGKLAVFFVVALSARALPLAGFATISLAVTFGWIVAVATDFGLQIQLARVVARTPEDAGDVLRPLLRVRASLAAIGTAAIFAGASWFSPPGARTAFVLVAFGQVASAFVEFLNHAFRGLGRSEFESILNFGQRAVSLVLAVILITIWPSATSVGVALTLPALVTIGVSLSMLAKLAPARGTTASAATFAAVAPIGVGILLSALYFRVDLFLLNWLSGSDAVARYGAAFRLLDALRLFPAAVLTVAMPSMFRGRDAKFAFRISAGLALFGVVAAVVLYFVAPIAVPLAFGHEYVQATGLFQILLIALPLLSLNYGMTTQLLGWDGQRAFAAVCLAALVANLAMNALLIPAMGAAGAAWSTVGTEVVVTLVSFYALRRLWPREPA